MCTETTSPRSVLTLKQLIFEVWHDQIDQPMPGWHAGVGGVARISGMT